MYVNPNKSEGHPILTNTSYKYSFLPILYLSAGGITNFSSLTEVLLVRSAGEVMVERLVRWITSILGRLENAKQLCMTVSHCAVISLWRFSRLFF